MTTGPVQRLELRGANLYGERSALVLALARSSIAARVGSGPGAPDRSTLWRELVRIAVDDNPLPGAPPDDAVQVEAVQRDESQPEPARPEAVQPLLRIATQLCLALLSRFEAQPPAARIVRCDDALDLLVVFCDEPELAAQAWEIAAQAIGCLVESNWSLQAAQVDRLIARHARYALDAAHSALEPDTLAILRELRRRGLPCERMVEGFGIVQLGQGRYRRRFRGLRLETTGSHALRLASAERALRLTLERAALATTAECADGEPAGELAVWVVGGEACAVTRIGAAGESDATDSAPPEALELARRCAKLLQLDPAPVRIGVADAASAVAGILAPARLPGEAAPLARRRVLAALADRLTQDLPGQGRIASAWFSAGCEGTDWAECLESILRRAGHVVGAQLPGVERIAGRDVASISSGRLRGWPAALVDPRSTALVLQVGANAAREHGIGVDCCDVAVWRPSARPQALASFPGECVGADALDRVVLGAARSMAVLDGDDPHWPEFRSFVRASRLCLASRHGPSDAIRRHLREGSAAAWIERTGHGAVLVVRDGARDVAAIVLSPAAEQFVGDSLPGEEPRSDDPARETEQPAPEASSDEALLFAACAAFGLGVAPAALGDAVRAIVARRAVPGRDQAQASPDGRSNDPRSNDPRSNDPRSNDPRSSDGPPPMGER